MSMFNILMYPRWAKVKGRPVFEDTPPLIQDVLGESLRYVSRLVRVAPADWPVEILKIARRNA